MFQGYTLKHGVWMGKVKAVGERGSGLEAAPGELISRNRMSCLELQDLGERSQRFMSMFDTPRKHRATGDRSATAAHYQ